MENKEIKPSLQGPLFLEVFLSKKGSKCVCLKVNLGTCNLALTFKTLEIAVALGVSVVDLLALPVGQYNV